MSPKCQRCDVWLFQYLDNVNWAHIYNITDVNCAVAAFTKHIVSALERFVPKKRPQTSRYPHWYSFELRSALRSKLRYHRKYKASNSAFWYAKFSESRAQAKSL